MGKKKFTYLDIIFTTIISIIILLAIIHPSTASILTPILLCLVGLIFIYSNKLKSVSLVARLFCWISYNVFIPRSEYSHIVWGAVFFGLGIFSAFSQSPKHVTDQEVIPGVPTVQEFQSWWYKDPIFWVVILLLIFIGIYRSKSKKP